MNAISNEPTAAQAAVWPGMSPEQMETMLAEIRAERDQELHGEHVRKVSDRAVVTVENEVVVLKLPITYPELLSAIVRRRYDADRAEAVTANYLKTVAGDVPENKASEYRAEYEAYQSWRAKAKMIAKEVMGTGENTDS